MEPSERKRTFLDHFVPHVLKDPEEAQRWRYMAAGSFLAAVTSLLFAVEYTILGAALGSYFLYGAAVVLVILPYVGRAIANQALLFSIGGLAIMSTLSVSSLSKGDFGLSSLMWMGFIPVAALIMLGARWMWITLVVGLCFGTLCYFMPLWGLTIGHFPTDESTQLRQSYLVWVLFMFVAVAIAQTVNRAKALQDAERKRMEECIQNFRHMQAIGELAGGVAHEFNNLLTVIQGTANLLNEEKEYNARAAEGLADIETAAMHGGQITRELLTFARSGGHEKSGTADPVQTLKGSIRLLSAVLERKIEVITTIPEELPRVAVAARAIEQTVLNMALNARDAMPAGGTLSLEIGEVSLDGGEARALGISAGVWVRLRIADTGHGMDGETVARIYEPFFTTKDTGTGLGLAVVFGVIRRAGGAISLHSKVGEGTRFDVFLPLCSSDSPDAQASRTEPMSGARIAQ